MCNYILTSFIELDDFQFNNSNYTVKNGNETIEWFHPSYTEFENILSTLLPPDNYEPKDPSTMMEAKREDPKLFFIIDNFAKAL